MDTTNLRSPADRFLWAIMELVDRNVHVHAWDGSVFSGIFYTACFDNQHCIILKNARMTTKGKSSANVTEGVPINILIIQAADFVQVVVKKDELPSKGIAGNDVEVVAVTIASPELTATTAHEEEHIDQTRQTRDGISQREYDGRSEEIVDDIEEGSSLQLDSSDTQVTAVDERHASGVSPSSSSVVDVTSDTSFHLSAAPTEVVSPQGSEFNKTTPESKLNPEAQNFAPSFTKPEAEVRAGQANADMASMPHYHVAPSAARPEVGVGPYAYQYPVPGNGGPQFSQPVIRHMGSGIQPVRFDGQYPPAHAGPPYVHPNSPNVMAAPYEYPLQNLAGQHPYMQQHPYVQHPYLQHPYAQYPYTQHPYVQHPYGNVITYDVVHGTAAIPPVPARPQVNPYHIQYPKNQGSVGGQALQLCMPPSFLTGGQQRVSVPSHFSLLQSRFSASRRIPGPGSNGLFSTKLS